MPGTHDPDDAPADADARARHRRAWGRFTRNFVVQGTGAEWALCWIADLRNRLWRLGGSGTLVERPHLVLFLHDEVVVHAPAGLAEEVAAAAAAAAATAAGLLFRELPIDFPLSTAVVRSYAEAGKPDAGPDAGPARGRRPRGVAGPRSPTARPTALSVARGRPTSVEAWSTSRRPPSCS